MKVELNKEKVGYSISIYTKKMIINAQGDTEEELLMDLSEALLLYAEDNYDQDTGAFPAHLQPTQNKNLYNGNYVNFTDPSTNQWAQQFMPSLYKNK